MGNLEAPSHYPEGSDNEPELYDYGIILDYWRNAQIEMIKNLCSKFDGPRDIHATLLLDDLMYFLSPDDWNFADQNRLLVESFEAFKKQWTLQHRVDRFAALMDSRHGLSRDLVLQALPEDEKLCKLIAHVTQDELEIPVPAREAVSNQLQQDIIPRTLGEHFDWNWIQNDTYRDDIQTQLRNREITLFDCEIEIVTSAGKHFLAVLLPVANNERLFFPLELNDGTSYAVLNGMANTKKTFAQFRYLVTELFRHYVKNEYENIDYMIREYASQELGSIREMWMNDENLRSEEHFLFQLLQYIDRHSDSKHQLVFQLRSPRKSEFHEDIEIDTLVARVEEVSNESITLVVSHDSMSETVVKLVEGSGSDGHYQFISGNRGEFKKLKDHIQASIRMFDNSTRSQVSHIHDYRLYLQQLSLLQQKFDNDVDSGAQVDEDVMNDFLRLLNQANSQVYKSENLQAVLSFESTPDNGEQERRSWVHHSLLRLFSRAPEDDKNN